MEETIIMIKPGFGHLRETVLAKARRVRLRTVLWGRVVLTDDQARRLYRQVQDEPWREQFIAYITSGPVSVFLVRGTEAFRKALQIKEEVRAQYAIDEMRNAVHSPRRLSKRVREIEFFQQLLGPKP